MNQCCKELKQSLTTKIEKMEVTNMHRQGYYHCKEDVLKAIKEASDE